MGYNDIPTIRAWPNFDPEQDAQVLRKAMKGMGTDQKAIVSVLARRSMKQRATISLTYKKTFGRDLVDDLKSELGGDLEDLMVALTFKYFDYLAYELYRAIKKMGTNEKVLNEVILPRNNSEIHMIAEAYARNHQRDLEEDLRSDLKGDIEKLLVMIVTGARNETWVTDLSRAKKEAQDLYAAGEKKMGTNEAVFRDIFGHENDNQILLICEEYKKISKKTLEEAIKSELSGAFRDALLIMIAVARDRAAFFAEKLYESMKGAGTDDKTLIRLVVSRSEIDLQTIKDTYQKNYGKTLGTAIEKDTSGNYRDALLALVRGIHEQ